MTVHNQSVGDQNKEPVAAQSSGPDTGATPVGFRMPSYPTQSRADTDSGETSVFEVLSEEQWRVHWVDIKAALAKPKLTEKYASLFLIYQHTRIGRALYRYQYQRGRLAAGGISFMAIFSLAAAVTVGWTIFAHFFASNPEFQESVIEAINRMLPGILQDPESGSEGLIDPDTMKIGLSNVVTGIIAFAVAVYSATRIVRYISEGMRSMFGLLSYPKSFFLVYPRYLLGLTLLLLTVVATAALSVAQTWLDEWLTSTLSLRQPLADSMTFDLATLLISLAVNLVTFYLMVRFVSDVRVPPKTLWIGSTAFAVIAAALMSVGTMVLGSSNNPLIVAAATVGTLMVWINILARATMMICAWMANPPAVIAKVEPDEIMARHTPNYVSVGNPDTLEWPYHPISGDLIPAIPEDEYRQAIASTDRILPNKPWRSAKAAKSEPPAKDQRTLEEEAGPLPSEEEVGPKSTEWLTES